VCRVGGAAATLARGAGNSQRSPRYQDRRQG